MRKKEFVGECWKLQTSGSTSNLHIRRGGLSIERIFKGRASSRAGGGRGGGGARPNTGRGEGKKVINDLRRGIESDRTEYEPGTAGPYLGLFGPRREREKYKMGVSFWKEKKGGGLPRTVARGLRPKEEAISPKKKKKDKNGLVNRGREGHERRRDTQPQVPKGV